MIENGNIRFLNEIQIKYCDPLIKNLENRFTDLPIISCFSLFDPTLLKSMTDNGVAQIETFCKLDILSCKQEWVAFKEVIRSDQAKASTEILKELLLSN